MKTLPVDLIRELKAEVHTIAHLFKIELSTRTYYWTDFKEDIYYNSQWYTSYGINFKSIDYSALSEADSIEFGIDNVNNKISDMILGQELRGRPVTIYLAALDKNIAVVDLFTLFYGFWDAAKVNQKSASVKIFNHIIKWKTFTPKRLHSATCPWTFKEVASVVVGTDSNNYTCKVTHYANSDNKPVTGGDFATYWDAGGASPATWVAQRRYHVGTCRYAGAETWCDLSWDRCNALSNTDNFGGFRWSSYIADKDIFWGKSQRVHPKRH